MPPYSLSRLTPVQRTRRSLIRGTFITEDVIAIEAWRFCQTDPFIMWVCDEMIAECEAAGVTNFGDTPS